MEKSFGVEDWDALYERATANDLSWCTDELDPDLARALPQGDEGLSVCDIGTSLGHQAIALARRRFHVCGFDVSSEAIARARARSDGLGVHVDFRVVDVTSWRGRSRFDVAVDRGCLHELPPSRHGAYADGVARLVRPGGHLLLKGFAASGSLPEGCHPLTSTALQRLFGPCFELQRAWHTHFAGHAGSPTAVFCAFRRR